MGLVTTTSLSLALMVVAPAFAVVGGIPEVNDPCVVTDVPVGFVCEGAPLVLVLAPVAADPAPEVVSAPAIPPADTVPTPPAAAPAAPGEPAPAVVAPVGSAPATQPGNNQPAATQPGGGPATPGGTSTNAVGPPASTAGGAPAGPSLRAAATGTDPAGASTSLLAAATVSTLASSDLPSLGALKSLPLVPGRAGLPLSAYTPSPALAGALATLPPSTRIAAVQAPLLAASEDAAGAGGLDLAGLSGRALPGLLVVLATALVASVGAVNIRVWQDRMRFVRS